MNWKLDYSDRNIGKCSTTIPNNLHSGRIQCCTSEGNCDLNIDLGHITNEDECTTKGGVWKATEVDIKMTKI